MGKTLNRIVTHSDIVTPSDRACYHQIERANSMCTRVFWEAGETQGTTFGSEGTPGDTLDSPRNFKGGDSGWKWRDLRCFAKGAFRPMYYLVD